METILIASQLTKRYVMGEVTVNALIDASFDIREGEFVVVLGPSGSGKSTLLNILGGMDFPDSGELVYRGTPVVAKDEKSLTRYRRERIGFVFQFFNLIPSLTAKENVMLAAEIAKNPLPVDDVLEITELSDRAGHFPSQLSGGQQQRVAIARAVIKNPDLLLCDEPTGALDLTTGLSVLRLLWDLNKNYGKTVIIITHNASIGEMADRVFFMRDGQLVKVQENENPIEPEHVKW